MISMELCLLSDFPDADFGKIIDFIIFGTEGSNGVGAIVLIVGHGMGSSDIASEAVLAIDSHVQ